MKIKRIVALLVSILLLASSMSVCFSAFAEESATIYSIGSDAIVKNGAEIGTATHYDYWWNPEKNWEDLLGLASEGALELNHKSVSSATNIHQGNGVYTTTANESYKKIIEKNGVGAGNTYACQNGSHFAAEFSNLYSCSNRTTHAEGCDGSCTKTNEVVTKQHGWDKQGYYYYDYYNEDGNGTEHTFGAEINWSSVKLRDESVKYPHSYETYTYSFPKGTLLKDVVLANSNGNEFRSSYYEIYATTGKVANLFNEENRVAVYSGTEDGKYAFASHFTFNEPIEVTYVGLKLIDPVSMVATSRVGSYYNAARIWMLKFFGTEGYEKCSVVTGALNQVGQTTASEDNYSIPAKIAETKSDYVPQHIYYRNGTPFGAGASNVDSRLWDRKTSADVQFDGRESYKSGGDLLYYDGTHTELFYDFGAIYDINEIIYANHTNDKLRASDMTFYASNNFEDLFTPANELTYEETNVPAISLKVKDVKARFVGISFQDTCWDNASYPGNDYLRACEFDVMGKYSGVSQIATVQNFANYTSALAAVENKTSVVAGVPQVYSMINGVKKITENTSRLENLYNGILSESDIPTYDLQHIDADGNYVYGPNVYTAFKYDLKLSRKITDIFLGNHDNSYYQASAYKVYVSEDETIDESDAVAQVVQAGRSTHFNIHANLISLPEGTTGRYVEVRIFMPTKMVNDGQTATETYTRLKELNIFGDMGYTLKGETYAPRESYFTKNAENIANSLIAMAPIYKAENVDGINFGARGTNTSKYRGTFGVKDWDEFSVGLTETTYYDTDGDLTGVGYTREVFACGGINSHAEGCPADETCTGKVEAIDDGSVYQTVIYKLNAKSTITEVDIYHSSNKDRLTSHYLLSFADKEEDLFTDAATTLDVANYIGYQYNLVKLNQPVTAKFFAVKLICGVQPGVIASNDYNYGRMSHFALVGESLACADDAHAWEEVIIATPDCVNAGSKCNVCTVCGAETAAEEIPALGHTEETVKGYAATCTTKGLTDGIKCSVCGETVKAQEEIKELGHTPEDVPGKPADCLNPGLTTGSKCSVCGEELTAQQVIDALGHNKVEIPAIPADCENGGFTAGVKCSECGMVFEEPAPTAPVGHTEQTVSGYPASCMAAGLTDGKICTVCEETLEKQEIIPILDHAAETIPGYEPDCINPGLSDSTKCGMCGIILSNPETIPPFGHIAEISGFKDPSYTEPGYTGDKVCKYCGIVLEVGTEIPVLTINFAEAFMLDGGIDCNGNDTIKVLFKLPGNKTNVRGMQLRVALPDGFTFESITTPLSEFGWVLNYHSNGFILLECNSQLQSLEQVSTPNENGYYHVFDFKLTPNQSVSVGDKYLNITVEDITTGFEANETGQSAEFMFGYYTEHDWQINREKEVKYCSHGCGVNEKPIYFVTFYGFDNSVIYEAVIDAVNGVGHLTEGDISAANASVPDVYGYDYYNWDQEINTNIAFNSSAVVYAVYERELATYNTVLETTVGIVESREIQFDQFVLFRDKGAKSFLVDGQIIGGAESVSLFGCGTLTITASKEAAPNEISVAILKTVTQVINNKNVYRVFVHVYNPTEILTTELGVIFSPGSAYTSDSNFTIESLESNKYKLLFTNYETNDLLATFNGITMDKQVTRVVRAYVKADNINIYSARVYSHTFN